MRFAARRVLRANFLVMPFPNLQLLFIPLMTYPHFFPSLLSTSLWTNGGGENCKAESYSHFPRARWRNSNHDEWCNRNPDSTQKKIFLVSFSFIVFSFFINISQLFTFKRVKTLILII